ncbi:MAG: hypothetical protein IKK66_08800 [Ruminococcus sp.]|nr:hypothetical protein [Ruminococcus sp.]
MDVKHGRKSKLLGISLILLILCEMASLAVLFDRISLYSETEVFNIIPLTKSDGNTRITVISPDKTDFADAPRNSEAIQLDSPFFRAYDKDTVWQAETNVDIFRISYDNTTGEMTVNGASENTDKLIAPGTSGEYTFYLENTGGTSLDYTMNMEAWISGTELNIPVKARVQDYNNNYLLGDNSNKAHVLELNKVTDSGALGIGRFASYTLEWEWPYEQGNDEYDTMLGDLAVGNDLALTIRINTTAAYNDNSADEDAGLESPKTGDIMPIHLIVNIFGFMLIIAAVCLFTGHCRKNEESNE